MRLSFTEGMIWQPRTKQNAIGLYYVWKEKGGGVQYVYFRKWGHVH